MTCLALDVALGFEVLASNDLDRVRGLVVDPFGGEGRLAVLAAHALGHVLLAVGGGLHLAGEAVVGGQGHQLLTSLRVALGPRAGVGLVALAFLLGSCRRRLLGLRQKFSSSRQPPRPSTDDPPDDALAGPLAALHLLLRLVAEPLALLFHEFPLHLRPGGPVLQLFRGVHLEGLLLLVPSAVCSRYLACLFEGSEPRPSDRGLGLGPA